MRLIFYIFFIYQLLNVLVIFAEIGKKDFSELNSVKWEKVDEDDSNSEKKIFWKTYEEDNYFNEDYKKDFFSEKDIKLSDENKLGKFGGLTVGNSILPRSGEGLITIDYDSSGNLFGSYSYSVSDTFQLNLINAGSFKIKDNVMKKNSRLTNIFLGNNDFNYRVGAKILFLNPDKNDFIFLSSRISLGSDLDSPEGYIYTDLTNTIKLNKWMSFNISPKYIFSNVGNLGAIGLSNELSFSKKFQFISEANLGITKNSSNNSTFLLRYAYSPANSIDIFATNAVSFQDIGTMLTLNDYKFGIRMNYSF